MADGLELGLCEYMPFWRVEKENTYVLQTLFVCSREREGCRKSLRRKEEEGFLRGEGRERMRWGELLALPYLFESIYIYD